MNELTSKQKATIRKYAQTIKSSFQIGAEGLHRANMLAIREGFNQKEVLKIKVNREDQKDKQITKQIAMSLSQEIPCEVAGIIGTTIIIYKENLSLANDKKLKF